MNAPTRDTFNTCRELVGSGATLHYFSLPALAGQGMADIAHLPFSIKILLESVLRSENGVDVTADDVRRLAAYRPEEPGAIPVPFAPARVLMQDFTGVPCVVDLAAMRSAVARLGGDPAGINPCVPTDLVIDHSLQVDVHACRDAAARNTELEFSRNGERYAFLKWGQQAFDNFRVIPPGRGICHQVNMEYLATVVTRREADGRTLAFPDSLVGTDSHTTMINGLGVLGWGVGGIEAEAIMLGRPLEMLAPPVVGVRLTGRLHGSATATDLALTVTEVLRRRGVVGSFVEFCGPGLDTLPVPDRATTANMAPEYGATMGFFPVDDLTLQFLRDTGRPPELVALVERYCRAQGLFRTPGSPEPCFQEVITIDLADVEPSLAGPSRPQDRIALKDMAAAWQQHLTGDHSTTPAHTQIPDSAVADMNHGAVVIASITSCTNTSNPGLMLAAGLLAKKAAALGLRPKPWVKTSLVPGSTVVHRYLERSGLLSGLEQLGFHVAGYGCATCIGNSGPLCDGVEQTVRDRGVLAAAVVSANRNFPGRIHPAVRASFLASPPLVVAYALAGTVAIDLTRGPIGTALDGREIFLSELWPDPEEIAALAGPCLEPELYQEEYCAIAHPGALWEAVPAGRGTRYSWDEKSTYIQEPSFFDGLRPEVPALESISDARVLALLGDSITTDHISPAGAIPPESPAGTYLSSRGVAPADYNSYGSRRGNHHVMTRGTFANIRLQNLLAPGTEGGWTTHLPTAEVVSIYEAAERYGLAGTPVIVLAGRDYGMGSSRDWAAKGTALLGVRAVIAESFERIHRSNLVGMGVLPLQFTAGQNAATLGLAGTERFTIELASDLRPQSDIIVRAAGDSGTTRTFTVRCRLDTDGDVVCYRNGGLLQSIVRTSLAEPGRHHDTQQGTRP